VGLSKREFLCRTNICFERLDDPIFFDWFYCPPIKVAAIFHLPLSILFIAIGTIGGGLTGLVCYAGYQVTVKEDDLEID
jgi:hypothetical protein